MPKISYIDKSFRRDKLQLIDKINEVIRNYMMQGYSLTLRQVYYQLVARAMIENNEKSYKNVGNLISDARLVGLIDWNSIEDRTRNMRGNSHWSTPGSIVESAAYSYHLDHWEGQNYYVEVWVEKDALIGIVGQICEQLDVNFFSCRGYVSQSEMWSAAQRLKRRQDQGQNVVLLHLGDHDPSGKDMSRDIQDRLRIFEAYNVEFQRLALNMNQIDKYNPPPNPAKLSDSRATQYINEFGYDSWELDALEPQVISDLIERNVKKYRNEKLYNEILKQEKREKGLLSDISANWNGISENWSKIKSIYC
nr:hypothetical protein [Sedimentibacter sp.]